MTAVILGVTVAGTSSAAIADDAEVPVTPAAPAIEDGVIPGESETPPTDFDSEDVALPNTVDRSETSTPSSLPATLGDADEPTQTSALDASQGMSADAELTAVVPCEGQALLVFETDASLNIIDPATGSILNTVGTGYELNAVGYNVQDGYLYGVTRLNDAAVKGGIYRVSLDGTAEQMTVLGQDMVPRQPSNKDKGSFPADSDIIAGDVDENGIYWAKTRSGVLFGLRINADGSLTEVSMSQVSVQSDDIADFSALPGSNSLWTLAKIGNAPRTLGAIDKFTGVYTNYGVGTGFDQITGVIGSYFDSAGNMYAFTDSGVIWAINRGAAISASGTATGVPLVARKITDVQTMARGDAAQCGLIKSSSLNIDKSVDQATAPAGGSVNYTITVTNTGETPHSGVTVTDVLPTNLRDAVAEDGGAVSGGQATWTMDLAPGESRAVHVHGTLAADLLSGDRVLNSASVDGPGVAVVTVDHVCEADSSSSCALTQVVDDQTSPAADDVAGSGSAGLPVSELAHTGSGDRGLPVAASLLLLGVLSFSVARRRQDIA
ncbi:DUF11 domain-containing protein [Lysinibacter cavernae]|uniref:Putative repeat protein (TIGR01451 family) n=1 Tax=Lysinibacter cavernae TaxID=1640652 RepID=A0A7X5TS22_9MICO|nr:DUF11 domain-containing protein [Lysinibacter cavernae]NIH52956.1 putative repeat protein (TIGR01451 family) [Lysinibacter cavernae]